eukprot:SAG31_NODE_142_length_22669_cov_18.630040_2_plen_69_part_00
MRTNHNEEDKREEHLKRREGLRILLTVLNALNVPPVLSPLTLAMLVTLEAANMVSSVKLSASQSMHTL